MCGFRQRHAVASVKPDAIARAARPRAMMQTSRSDA
jgi:hypothetical protein